MAIPESGQNLSPDMRRQEEARIEASKLLAALQEKEGKKAFFLVVDDKPWNLQGKQELITTYADKKNTGYVISLKKDGESALRLYQAFREQENPEHRNKVVAVLDGNLDSRDRYKYGKQVAQKLVEISTQNGWEAPYLVGGSGDSDMNEELQEAFPEHYVSTFKRNSQEEFDAIDAKL